MEDLASYQVSVSGVVDKIIESYPAINVARRRERVMEGIDTKPELTEELTEELSK